MFFEGFRRGWPAQVCVMCCERAEPADMVWVRVGPPDKRITELVCQKCAQKLREKMVAR